MLYIKSTKRLSENLLVLPVELERILEDADEQYEELTLLNPLRPDKPRLVVNVRGGIRVLQTRLYRRVLLPKLIVSPYSHGGIRGRSTKTNALAHVESAFIFKADISDFYPTVHRKRVYKLFVDSFACSPDVARLCTRLCTYQHHLALGLVTSPILADQVLCGIDKRIAQACHSLGLTYTRFVDDVTISGNFDLQASGVPSLIGRILAEHGFFAHKHVFGRLSDGVPVTGIRCNRRGHLDVTREYFEEVSRQLDDAEGLARGEQIERPYYTKGQIAGRIHFIRWVNPTRGSLLLRRYRSIPWRRVEVAAREKGLVICKKQLTKRGLAPTPILA